MILYTFATYQAPDGDLTTDILTTPEECQEVLDALLEAYEVATLTDLAEAGVTYQIQVHDDVSGAWHPHVRKIRPM